MGKTLLAKAVAGEAGVNFFSISASQFVEIYVGVGASRVRALYQEAKENVCRLLFAQIHFILNLSFLKKKNTVQSVGLHYLNAKVCSPIPVLTIIRSHISISYFYKYQSCPLSCLLIFPIHVVEF